MILFDGKNEAKKLDDQIATIVQENTSFLAEKFLAIVQIGENAESEKYINLKKKYGDHIGVNVSEYKISSKLNDLEISNLVSAIALDPDLLGVIIQLPLPRPSLNSILDLIPYEKDVDLLSSAAQSKFYSGILKRLSPVVLATEYFLNSINFSPINKKALILGSGDLVGKPVEFYLKTKGMTTNFVLDYKPGTKLDADLIVLGTGKPNLVDGADMCANASVIDFGSTIVGDVVVGDLDMKSKTSHLGFVSASPGGLGPLVVRFLFWNFLTSLKEFKN